MTRAFRKPATRTLITIMLLLTAATAIALGQKGTIITRRVQFERGQTSTTLKGKASWGASYVYLLRARAGQTLTVRVTGAPDFTIYPPGKRPSANTSAEDVALKGTFGVKDWSGQLPASGEYAIWLSHAEPEVSMAGDTLEVSIR